MHELRAYLKGPQKPLISLMQDFNLRADPNGVCDGVAVMSALYFLYGRKTEIANLLKFIYTDKTALTLAERRAKGEALSQVEWNAIAFLDGVELFQQAQYYRDVHQKEGINHFDIEAIAALLGFTDIAKAAVHFNVYSKWQWQHYLQAIATAAIAEKKSIAVVIDNHVHCINVCFDHQSKLWQLTNANHVPLAPASETAQALIQPCFNALFEAGDYLGVVSRLYLRAKNGSEINAFNERLQQQESFQLANQKCHIKAKTKLGITLAQLACYIGDETTLAECLKKLSSQELNQNGPGDFTLAHYAAYNGNPANMATLIAAGAKVNERSKAGLTPLMIAATYGHAELITKLAEVVSVEQRFAVDRTPLMLAAENGQSQAITALINAGADKEVKTADGYSALQIASLFHYQEAEAALNTKPCVPAQ